MTDAWWRKEYSDPTLWRPYEDFRVFLKLVWEHLNLPRPTFAQNCIAYRLQHGPRRDVIEAFRGVGKSWITSAFVCWLLVRDPQLKILVASASKERADQFSTFTLRLIAEMPMLQHLFPRTEQRCSKIAFDVAPSRADHAPSVKSVGIMGQMAGSRADVIVADDVEVPNNSETPTMRAKLGDRVKEFDAILKPGGRVLYLGTPQTEESLYNALPDRGYSIYVWPARFPTLEQLPVYGDKLAQEIADALERNPTLAGQPTDSGRFDHMDLLEREGSYGRSGFNLQFMLDTRLSDADRYPLRLHELVVDDLDIDYGPEKVIWSRDPRLAFDDLPCVGFSGDAYYRPMDYAKDNMGQVLRRKYEGRVMTIDPSGRGKDETAYAITFMLNSQVFLMDVGAFRDGYGMATLEALAMAAKKFKVNHIVVEQNFGDGMFLALLLPVLKRLYPCTAEEEHSSGQKEARIIDSMEPVINTHRLIVSRAVVEWDYRSTQELPPEAQKSYRLFYQMSRVTRDRGSLSHDDRLEAVSMGVRYWTEQMSADIQEKIETHQQEAMDKELERFLEHAWGRNSRPSESTWLGLD